MSYLRNCLNRNKQTIFKYLFKYRFLNHDLLKLFKKKGELDPKREDEQDAIARPLRMPLHGRIDATVWPDGLLSHELRQSGETSMTNLRFMHH